MAVNVTVVSSFGFVNVPSVAMISGLLEVQLIFVPKIPSVGSVKSSIAVAATVSLSTAITVALLPCNCLENHTSFSSVPSNVRHMVSSSVPSII